MYTVTVNEQVTEYETRAEAVAAARAASAETSGRVQVEDERQRELLTYRGGALESYSYETRRRGPRRPDEDDSDGGSAE